jgi:3-hydroxyisobutyrate dehydrogenase-like beta-hydroxyacid dehydrogenase
MPLLYHISILIAKERPDPRLVRGVGKLAMRWAGRPSGGAEPARMQRQRGSVSIAVLGLGEAGSLLARDLAVGGAVVRGWDPDLHGDLSGIPLAASFATAVDGADVVLSVNWATVALDVARDTLPYLRPGRIYADLNTAGPALKLSLAEVVAPSGASFVDVAMMSPVPPLGIRVPMFLAGEGAAALADIFRPFGTPLEIVGTQPGEAAARKLTRSVFFKGMSAAVYEALEAARAAGVEEWLRADITRTFVGADEKMLDRIVDGTLKHAVRRAHEMHDATELLDGLGVPATITRATTESLERIADARTEPSRPART